MTTLRATAAAYSVQRREALRTEACMTNLMMQLSETVSDERGTFHPRAMARERSNGSWEGWLEFVPTGEDRSRIYVTPIETHQHDRMTMEYWASGLTGVYAEGALARARMKQTAIRESDLLVALQELVEALDKPRRHLERAGEGQILVDARRLRVSAIKRIAFLREHDPDAHQTAGEQTARRNRDDLKGRLAGRLAPGSERKLRRK